MSQLKFTVKIWNNISIEGGGVPGPKRTTSIWDKLYSRLHYNNKLR